MHSINGRKSLSELLLRTVSMNGQRDNLINNSSPEVRDAISLACLYSAYLSCSQDLNYRIAYDLLYLIESLNREADIIDKDKKRQMEDSMESMMDI